MLSSLRSCSTSQSFSHRNRALCLPVPMDFAATRFETVEDPYTEIMLMILL
jgi:hypothetical protein